MENAVAAKPAEARASPRSVPASPREDLFVSNLLKLLIARGARLLRKYGNPSIREILVMTSSYNRPTDQPTVRPYVRRTHHVSQSQMWYSS